MRLTTARGGSREIGRALGEEGRVAVHEAVFESHGYAGLRPWLGSERLAAILSASERAYPAYVEEIRGIAEGAAAPFEAIFLWNCRGDLPPAGAETEGCTTVLLPPEGDRPGIIAHNEDGAAIFADRGFMARVEADGEPGFTSFCYPGMLLGHSFAMNDAGLVQTINNISPHDLTVGIARNVVCRAVLACRDMDAALAVLRRGDRASGFHHNLGSAAEGRLIAVEAPASGCVIRPVAEPYTHANHLIFPEFVELAQTVSPSSASRQARADALLHEAADPPDILFDRADEALPILCRGETANGHAYTLATALFRLDRESVGMEVVHGPSRAPVFSARADLALAA